MSRDQILTSAVTRAIRPSMAEIDMPSIGQFTSAFAGLVGKKQRNKILEIVVED